MGIKGSLPYYRTDIDTLLFDLDETLIHSRRLVVEPVFVLNAVRRMKGVIPLWKFYPVLRRAVKKSKTHRSLKTNHRVLLEELAKYSNASAEEIDNIIQIHLHGDFEKLAPFFTPVPDAKDTVLLAQKLGYKMVVATNPSIPLCTVNSRLKWAGLEKVPFDFITHSEIMTRCKPDPAYYLELLAHLNIKPERCLMIGNDMEKDLAAEKAGILTCILHTRWTHNRLKKKFLGIDLQTHGSHKDLQAWMKEMADERVKKALAENKKG